MSFQRIANAIKLYWGRVLLSLLAGLGLTLATATVNVPDFFEEHQQVAHQTEEGLKVEEVRAGPERRVLVERPVLPLDARGPFPDWLSPFDPDHQSIDATASGWPMPVLVRESNVGGQLLVDLARQRGQITVGFRLGLYTLRRNEVFGPAEDILRFHGIEFDPRGRIYFPGFCFNAAIYSLAVFILSLTASTAIAAFRRRIWPHACANCNYDLRGLPRVTSGSLAVCPECGSPVLPSPPASPVGSQAEERACQGIASR